MSIQLNHLTHVYNEGTTFEKVALNDVTLEIQTGEFIGLIGHTGSGKSTLIQHLNGIISPSSGEILLDGENIHKDKSKLKVVAMLINTETGEIVNAAERAVGTFGTGISVVDPSEKEVKEVARYTIDGVHLSSAAKGINIF